MSSGGHTPIKNFLLEAIVDGRLSQREMRLVLALARRTYGWREPGNPSRRMDRAQVSQADLADDTSMDPKHCRDALRSLEARNIVISYEKGAGRRKGVYGIQSDVSAWINGPKEGRNSPTYKEGRNSPTYGAKTALFTDPKQPYLQASTISSEPSNDKGLRPTSETPKETLKENIINKPPTPKGVGFGCVVSDLGIPAYRPITTVREALERNPDLTTEEALAQAERIYTAQFAQPFSPADRLKLQTYFSVSPFQGTLLAFWLTAVPRAAEDRQQRKRDPEKRRYVAKSPFRDCHALAAEIYTDAKAELEARKRASRASKMPVQAVAPGEIAPIRPLFAVEPVEKSGSLLDRLRREGGAGMR